MKMRLKSIWRKEFQYEILFWSLWFLGMHMTASMLSEKVLSVLQDAHEKVREEIRALIDILTKSCQEGLPSTNFDASYHTRSQLLDKLLTAQIETDVFISAVNAVGNFGLFEAFSVN
eukprot:TRINITY_DN4523_c0_g2_i3.p1 TRINITY_DN4523_c0_g2~~TRINITY_DN4523_c0_g2_i3.p1  ORF type:complete len:117 (+),score=11.98 TRINITY_DN4523_c0_g2_i3:45-395(+)